MAAVGQVLGDAATEEMVRPPAHKAAVEGTFSVGGHHVGFVSELLTEAGLPRGAMPQGDGPLDVTVRREVRGHGVKGEIRELGKEKRGRWGSRSRECAPP